MALSGLKTGLKKFCKYLGLGSITTLLTVSLGLQGLSRASVQYSLSGGGGGEVGRFGDREKTFFQLTPSPHHPITPSTYPIFRLLDWRSRVAGMAGVDAAVPDAPVVRSSTSNASQMMQAGIESYESGQFAAAVTQWKQAADAFAAQGDRLHQAMVLSNLALAYHELGQLPEANRAITTSLQLLQKEGDGSDRLKILAQALNTQGKLQLSQGQAEQALATWQKATATYQQVRDKIGVTRSLINQAQALRVLGFYLRLQSTLEEVNQTLLLQPDSAIKAAALLSFGDALRLTGNLKKSSEVLQQSLEISKRLQSPSAITAALLSLGNTAYAQQQPEAALKYYQQASATSTSPMTTIEAQLNQLRLLTDTEKWAEAQALASKIQPQVTSLPASRRGIYARINFTQSLIKVVGCHQVEGDRLAGCTLEPSPSNPHPSTATSTSNPQPSTHLSTLAGILATSVQQAKQLGDQRAESYALGYLGHLYEQTQQWSEALELTQQALRLAESSNARDIAYLWQWQLGRLFKAQGKIRSE